uniref:Uncharacterized protein n=1 Tax=Ignisphaera aggregans TaxID=334771 RepID=A0A7C5TKJ5_9CREN
MTGIVLVLTLLSLLYLAYVVGEPTFDKTDKIIIIARDEGQVSYALLKFIESHYTSQDTNGRKLKIIPYFTYGVVGRVNYFLEKHQYDNSLLGYVMLIDDLEFQGIDFSFLKNKTVIFVNTILMINRLESENISYLSPSTLEAFRFIKLQMDERGFLNACIVSQYDAISINIALELYELFKTRKYNSKIVFSIDDCGEELDKVLVMIDATNEVWNLTWKNEKYELLFLITNLNIPLHMDVDEHNLYVVFKELLVSNNESLLLEFINTCDNLSLDRCTYIDYLTYRAIQNLLKNREQL